VTTTQTVQLFFNLGLSITYELCILVFNAQVLEAKNLAFSFLLFLIKKHLRAQKRVCVFALILTLLQVVDLTDHTVIQLKLFKVLIEFRTHRITAHSGLCSGSLLESHFYAFVFEFSSHVFGLAERVFEGRRKGGWKAGRLTIVLKQLIAFLLMFLDSQE
jgi:hypothetical protein